MNAMTEMPAPLVFTETPDGLSTRYDSITVSLNRVPGGNARTHSINDAQFGQDAP